MNPPILPAVLLSIDPGLESGFCIYDWGKIVKTGTVNPFDHKAIDDIIAHTWELCSKHVHKLRHMSVGPDASGRNLTQVYLDTLFNPPIVVAEKWTPHGLSHVSYGSLCGSYKSWEMRLKQSGIRSNRIARVYPQTWRATLFGRLPRRATRELLKSMSINAAQRIIQRYDSSASLNIGADHNIADSICILEWALRSRPIAAIAAKSPTRYKRVETVIDHDSINLD